MPYTLKTRKTGSFWLWESMAYDIYYENMWVISVFNAKEIADKLLISLNNAYNRGWNAALNSANREYKIT